MRYLLFIALYTARKRNEFLNLFSAAAYRISVGLVMSVTGDRVTLQWCDVPGVLLPPVGDRRFSGRFMQLALYLHIPYW